MANKIQVTKNGQTRTIQESQLGGFQKAGFKVAGPAAPEAKLGREGAAPRVAPPGPESTATREQTKKAYEFAHGEGTFPGFQEDVKRAPRVTVDTEQARETTQKNIQDLERDRRRVTDSRAASLRESQRRQQQLGQPQQPPEGLSPMEQSYNEQKQLIDQELNNYLSQLDQRMAFLDEQNQAAVQEIKNMYAGRRSQMETLNKATLNAQKLAGVRSGRQRYATEIQTSILSNEEKAGLDRLRQLDMEERQLIQQAENAHKERQWDMLNNKMNRIQETRREKAALVEQQHQMAVQQEQLAMQKADEARKQLAFDNELAQQNRQQAFQDLDFMMQSGVTSLEQLGPEKIEEITQMTGYSPELIGNYFNAAKLAQEAKTKDDQIKATKEIVDILSKIPANQTIMIGGSEMSGLKEVDFMKGVQQFTEKDEMGNVTQITTRFNPETGETEVVNMIDLGQIAAPKQTEVQRAKEQAELDKLVAEIDQIQKEATGEVLSSEQRKTLFNLRDEANKDPDIKGYIDVRDAYDRVKSAAEDPSGAGDLALIFNYMKVLDPGSVVREGEFANAENSAGIPSKIRNLYNKTIEGKRLTEDQRADFVDRAGRLVEPKKANYENAIQFYKREAELEGLPVDRVVRDFLTPTTEGVQNLPPITQSFSSLDALIETHPEYYGVVEKLDMDNPNLSDADIIQILSAEPGTSFNLEGQTSLKGSTKAPSTKYIPSVQQQSRSDVGGGVVTAYGSKLWKPGLDYVVSGGLNAPVKAPSDGVVIDVIDRYSNLTGKPNPRNVGKKQNKGFGNQVKIRTADGQEMWISHLESSAVKKGQRIRAGQTIAYQGNTGSSYGRTGIHLDITMPKPGGGYFSAKEVAAFLNTRRV